MTQFIFIRHGKPDYAAAATAGIPDSHRDFAPLSEEGRKQAQEAALDPILKGAQLILSSPFTRALETATEIARATGIPLIVEPALHEWLADRAFDRGSSADESAQLRLYRQSSGKRDEAHNYETADEMDARVLPCLERYLSHQKVIVVGHGEMLARCTGQTHIPYCARVSVEVETHFPKRGWIE